MIDVHAHFLTPRSGRSDWEDVNRRRMSVGNRIGIDVHVASILGTWGHRSPTYFPSPEDVEHANEFMRELADRSSGKIKGYCLVNPNYPDHAESELEKGLAGGMIGIKLAASRRADDDLLDPIGEFASSHHLPILHHVWQHRRQEWPGQEASDAVELSRLADRHPDANFLLAHLGGGGDWRHSLRIVSDIENIFVDLSGSGVDAGMLEAAVERVGVDRLLWGTDLTMDTGLAKLRYLATFLPDKSLEQIKATNARRIFAPGAFGS